MAKYKVGDKVRVKDYPVDVGPGWVESMNEMLGKIVKIRRVTPGGGYRIEGSYYEWCDEMFEDMVQEDMVQTTGNEIIDLLMKKLGVEIDEEFEIIRSIYSPYKITEKGFLIDCDGDERNDILAELILGQRTIKKIPKPEIKEMTVSELEKALKLPKGTLRVKEDD